MDIRSVYLNDEEAAFVRSKPKGYIRTLVQAAMGNPHPLPSPSSAEKQAPPKKSAETSWRNPSCKKCGGMTMAGKCLVCGEKQ